MLDRDWAHQMSLCSRVIKDEEEDYIKRRCLGKKGHDTEDEAVKESVRMTMKFQNKYEFGHYFCEVCERWKVGRRQQ